jgi:hypothetical protein
VCGIQQRDLLQRRRVRAAVGIRVEGINAVVLCGNENNDVRVLARNGHVWGVQRLRVYPAVHRIGEDLAESVLVDVLRKNRRLGNGRACNDQAQQAQQKNSQN